jgi:hypothetical protein
VCEGASCYYMPTLSTVGTRAEADVVCAAMGAHVLATETQQEHAIISTLIASTHGKCYTHTPLTMAHDVVV